ncbi:methyltransferase domain-containing protein [Rhizobiaceae bacterium]|nr:methyltransferase domain-containing protein [Rhizobiaceae bacterium]
MNLPRSTALARKFDEELRFFKSWIDKPKAMGAVLPTSATTARRMASVIRENPTAPVLELGPGTGVITRAILQRGVPADRLYSVEYTADFIPQLQSDFPGVNFIHGSAFDLDTLLGAEQPEKFEAVVSAIPMLNFAVADRQALLRELLNRTLPGRPVVQISYGPVSPIPPDWSTYSVEPLDWMMRNIPPARLWVYRRIAGF